MDDRLLLWGDIVHFHAVQFDFWIGLLAATALIWGAGYSLWMYKRVVRPMARKVRVKNQPRSDLSVPSTSLL